MNLKCVLAGLMINEEIFFDPFSLFMANREHTLKNQWNPFFRRLLKSTGIKLIN